MVFLSGLLPFPWGRMKQDSDLNRWLLPLNYLTAISIRSFCCHERKECAGSIPPPPLSSPPSPVRSVQEQSAIGSIKACRGGSGGCKSETWILELPKKSCHYIRNMFIFFKWYCIQFGTDLWLVGMVSGIGRFKKKKKKLDSLYSP